MKTIKVTPVQFKVLHLLSRKDLSMIKKHPHLVPTAKLLLKTCRKVVKKVEGIPEFANRRKRQTAYKRIAAMCRKAIETAGG